MHKKKKEVEAPKTRPLVIGEKEDKIKGKVNSVDKYVEIHMFRNKSSHYANGAWLIPKSLVTYLSREKFNLRIIDKDSKWQFDIKVEDLVYYGSDVKNDKAVPSDKFDVLKGKNRTVVVHCFDSSCKFNFGNQCTKGGITITKEGKCGYLD